jgi:iron(III) transport system permease protein
MAARVNIIQKKAIRLLPAVIWWVVVVFLAFVVIFPSITLIINSFKTETGYSLSNYAMVFKDESNVQSMINSVKVVFATTFFATVIGVFLAWAVARTDVPGKKAWQLLLSIPYFIPPFIGAIAWIFLLGPVGYFNRFFMSIFSLEEPLFKLYSIPGMIFVLSLYRYAVPFIVVLPTMRKIPASMEEAARISGASAWKTMRDITLPLLAPSIIGAMLLLFMFVLADFGVSAALGAPNRIRLMTTQIFFLIRRPDMPNSMQIAAAYSILLSVFGLLGLWLYNRVLKTNKFSVVTGKSAAAEPVKLGYSKWILFAALLVIFLISTCAPIIAALITSLTRVFGRPFGGVLSNGLRNITFNNFSGLLLIPNIVRSFKNSLMLASVSGLIIAGVTLIIAYIAIRGGVRGVRGLGFMQTMVTLPYALPGTIIAIAMILAFARPLPLTGWKLYGTIWILFAAYIARFLNLGYNNISGAISQIDPSLEEAARISGASHIRAFGGIMLPLLRGSMIGSFFLVVAPTLSEVTLSTLLWSVGSETIGTVVYSAQEEGKILRAAALAITLIILVILINIFIQYLAGRENRAKRSGSGEETPALTME